MKKYAEVMNAIERKIEDGTIRGGQRLPSIRESSESYSCSKSTVIRAYTELEKRHIIYSIPQSGYYLVMKQIELEHPPGSSVIDFSSPSPDPDLFPYVDFQHCLNKAIDIYRSHLFTYGTPQGLPSLLNVMSKHLTSHQVFTSPEHIIITSGVQQALGILSMMPFPNNKRTVLLEQPSYHQFIHMLSCYGIPSQGIARTNNGIDLDELERIFRTGEIKMFYTIPRFHNPLGTSYSEQTKKAIAELAKRYNVYIVEDDYLADMETDTKSDPIYAYGSSHVIYLKSYSKILFPGLRVGVAVLPPALLDTFSMYKRVSDIDSSMLSQAALEIYIQSGMFERRKQKIKTTYHSRILKLNSALETFNTTNNIQHAQVNSGVHTHIVLPEQLYIPSLLSKLRKKHVVLKEMQQAYLPSYQHQQSMLMLSITRVAEDHIDEGVHALFAEIKKLDR